MIKGNQSWDQSSEEASGSVFFKFLIVGNLPPLLVHASVKPNRAVAALQSISVGYEATDGKNKMFDQG